MVLLPWNSDTLLTNHKPTLGISYVQASQSSVVLVDSANHSIEIDQNIKLGLGGVVWNCGRALVEFISQNRQLIENRKVLELGCGSGAVGLFCCHYDPSFVMLTDLAEMLPLVHHNAQKVALQSTALQELFSHQQLVIQTLKWGDAAMPSLIHWDTLLCSDCLYNAEVYDDFKCTISCLATPTTTVLIAYKQRHLEREKEIFKDLESLFTIQVHSLDGITPWNYRNDSVFILVLQKRLDI